MAALFAASSPLLVSAARSATPRRTVRAADSSTGGQIGQANKKMWLPGAENPPYLDGSLPGDYGA
jgi:hypothetical protein